MENCFMWYILWGVIKGYMVKSDCSVLNLEMISILSQVILILDLGVQ